MRSFVLAVCGVAAAAFMFQGSFAKAPDEKKTPQEKKPLVQKKVLIEKKTPDLPTGTHEVINSIEVKTDTKGLKLQTICANKDGHVYALLGSNRYGDKASTSEVRVYDGEGQKVRDWKVSFASQAINCAPDGAVFVAGDGKLAVYDTQGHVQSELELPFIKILMSDSEELKKKAEEQRDNEIKSAEEQIKEYKDQADEIKKKDEEKRTDDEKRQLAQHESMIKIYEKMLNQAKKKSVEKYIEQIAGRIRIVNAIAVTDNDIFVTCGEVKGYGYAVWRMDRKFENPKQIMSGLRGCCGQMDIQCCDDCVIVAQNCDHCVGKYDRDGKKLSTFGKRAGRDSSDGFGGCCNPMNVRSGSDGRIFTAESEGIIRVFDKEGKDIGVIGSVKLTGGCKNVALAASADGNTIWFCDQPGSKIHVLKRKQDLSKSVSN